jgi:ComF family protein
LEAVFSSSEDRIPAGHASVGGAGVPIALARNAPEESSSNIPPILVSSTWPQTAKFPHSSTHDNWAVRMGESLFSVLFPSNCHICNSPLTNISRLPVCLECLDQILPLRGKLCPICGERVLTPHAIAVDGVDLRCGLCRRAEPPFARAAAYGSYEAGLRALIHLLKYRGVRPAANVLGSMLAEAIAAIEPGIEQATVPVIPVPLYKGKRHQRGFNQAELIAQAALKHISSSRFVLSNKILKRQRETQSQIGLTSHQRRENLRGAFAVAHAVEIAGREVLLVDDVFTTGTTVSECTRVLRRAGATKVWVATVARTMKTASQSIERKPPLGIAEATGTEVQDSRRVG